MEKSEEKPAEKEMEKSEVLLNLPVELLLHVFSYFSVKDLHKVMLVQSGWHSLITEEDSLWKIWSYSRPWWFHKKMRADAKVDPAEESGKSWKELFIDSYDCERNWIQNKHKMGVISGVIDEDLEVFHFQDSTLVTNSYEGILKVWNMETLEYVRAINNQDGEIVWFEFVDNVLASSHLVHTGVNIFDVATGDKIDNIDSSQWVNALCFSNNQLICGEVSNVRVWDLNKHEELSCISTDIDTNLDIWIVDNIVLCGNDRNIRAYDLRSNRLVQIIEDWPSYFWYQWETQIIYTPETDGSFQAWDVKTKQPVHTFYGHDSSVESGYMEDSKFVTSSCEQICVWDTQDRGGGKLKYSIPVSAPIWGIATEERWMVAVNMLNDVYVWHF